MRRTVFLKIRKSGKLHAVVDLRRPRDKKPGKTFDLRHETNKYLRPWWTIPEVLARLQVSKVTLRRYSQRGYLRFALVHSGAANRFHLRYNPKDVLELHKAICH